MTDISDKISYKEKIGSGGHCDVYEVNFCEDIDINSHIIKEAVIKKFKNDVKNIDGIVKLYNYIKANNLKTLMFMKEIRLENCTYLLTNNINISKKDIYVSPNTKVQDIEKQKMRDALLWPLKANLEYFNSRAEEFRSNNKINSIIDFKITIRNFRNEMRKAALGGIQFYNDAFFFGSSLVCKISRVDYLIADFDTIMIHQRKDRKRMFSYLYVQNNVEMLKSFLEFIHKYVEESNTKIYYINFLDKIYDKLMKINPN